MTTATQTAVKPVEVGDVFSSSWGYDQTNVDWYVVTKVSASGKTAEFIKMLGFVETDNGPATYVKVGSSAQCDHCWRAIRPLKLASGETVWRHTATGQTSCYVERVYGIGDVPDRWTLREGRPACEAAPVTLKRKLNYYDNGDVWANAHASYASMKRWNGEAKYQTGAGWGH